MPFTNSVVGGRKLVRDAIESSNWDEVAETGWQINRDGSATFNNVTVRGSILGGTILIGTAPDVFGVDASGNMFLGNTSFATAPFRVSNNGAARTTGSFEFLSGLTLGAIFADSPGAQFVIQMIAGVDMVIRSNFDLQFESRNVIRRTLDDTAETTTLPQRGQDGTAAAPAYSFSGDTNVGMYRIGADSLGFSTTGTLRRTIGSAAETTTLPQRGPDGTAAAPAYSFAGNTDMGFYRSGTTLNWSVDNNTGGYLWNGGIRTDDGSVSAPAYSFTGDTDTGMYRSGAEIRFAMAGVESVRFTTVNVQFFERTYQIDGNDIGLTLRDTGTSLNTLTKYMTWESSQGTRRGLVGSVGGTVYLWNDSTTHSTAVRANGHNGLVVQADGDVTIGASGSADAVDIFGTNVRIPDATTSANAANTRITAGGEIREVTSRRAVKKNVRPIKLSEAKRYLRLVPAVSYKSRIDRDDGRERHIGFIADDCHAARVPGLGTMRGGKPWSVNYERVSALNKVLIEDLYQRIERLEAA